MAKSMKLGGGGRFEELAKKTGSKKLAAWIGAKKHGQPAMTAMAKKGKERAKVNKKKKTTTTTRKT